MWALLQYLIISLILIGSTHYIYVSLNEFISKEDSHDVPFIIDKKKEEKSKQEILKHMREEEQEADELTRYVKDKIKVLNTPDTDSNN